MNRSVLRGIVLILIAVGVVVALVAIPKKVERKHTGPNDDPWVLVSYDPNNKYGTYLGNGFISTRIMGDGVGSQDGRPLPCYMTGLYDDEKMIPTPTWSDLRFYDGKTRFTIDKDADYKQTLNMKTGILTTYATWRAGDKTLKGKIEVIVSRAEPNIALLRATMASDYSGTLSYRLNIDQQNAVGPLFVTVRAYKFHSGVCIAYSYGLGKNINLSLAPDRVRVRPNSQFSVPAVVAITQPGVDANVTSRELVSACSNIDKLIAAHKSAWAKLWKHDIIIDGPRKDQQVIHSCMFYLLQSVREGSQWSVPPMGLSTNDPYQGHIFWDADLWIFPALILQHPELAKAIVDYRFNTLPGAMANAKADGFAGAQYAWESGYTGKEDTPPGLVYRHERHINGDVALAQWQYYLATGDLTWLKTRGWPVLKATADYWASRVKFVPEKGRYEILKVVPPDENAELINNSVYTNAIAQMNLNIAMQAAKLTGNVANPKWADVAARMYIPFDPKNKRFIARDGYTGFSAFDPKKVAVDAKQADTELLIYPLQYKINNKTMTDIYKNTFEFYAPRVQPNGPAMTSSAHSVIAARLGDCPRAYGEFVKSYDQYLRGPFNYFNEKRSRFLDNTCFLTGAAGPIQATLFGLAGARMDYFLADPKSAQLQFAPCLPGKWKSLNITGVRWRGKSFDVTVTRGNKVTLTPTRDGG
ncbi:MAG: hypothetical protein M1133_10560 [Armatimonadetes bacterium]|nr:hypothetical protein [Armatimonadota bacterium]